MAEMSTSGKVQMFTRSVALISLFVVAVSAPRALAAENAPADLVLVQQGSLPIILTAPHGGREKIAGVAPREMITEKVDGSRRWGGLQRGGDPNTDILVQGIAAEIKALLGRDAYLVMAKFDRKFIDANRPPDLAFDSAEARPYYDYYHNSIRRFIAEIRKRYPAGLLIDVHGQKKDPAALMRGTRNGSAVRRLLQRYGQKSIVGPNGLFGQLEVNGFKVFPANDIPIDGTSENAGFNGGYTVFTYGSHNANGRRCRLVRVRRQVSAERCSGSNCERRGQVDRRVLPCVSEGITSAVNLNSIISPQVSTRAGCGLQCHEHVRQERPHLDDRCLSRHGVATDARALVSASPASGRRSPPSSPAAHRCRGVEARKYRDRGQSGSR